MAEQNTAMAISSKDTPGFEPRIEIEDGLTNAGQPCRRVYFLAPPASAFGTDASQYDGPLERRRLADVCNDQIVTFPIHVRWQSSDYLEPKYGSITSIVFAHEHVDDWSDCNDRYWLMDWLQGLPAGFAKQYQYEAWQ